MLYLHGLVRRQNQRGRNKFPECTRLRSRSIRGAQLMLPSLLLLLWQVFGASVMAVDLKTVTIQVTDMAHNLGLMVTAEGVEAPAGIDHLIDMDCDCVQGFVYSKPLPLSELLQWIATRNPPASNTIAAQARSI